MDTDSGIKGDVGMDTRIYIMAHKKFNVPKNAGYIPLQVGSEGSDDLGYTRDNTGENISKKNKSYCELTGTYWIWKNVNCDIVGICHYRRYFVSQDSLEKKQLEDVLLDTDYLETCLKNYDIVIPDSGMTMQENVRRHYEEKHNINDLHICERVLQEKYPEDYRAFEWVLERNLMTLGNMTVAPKALFDEYCNWLFDILAEVEMRIDITSYDDYQKRVFGFLAERLFRAWLINRPLKIREEHIIFLPER